MDGFDALLKLVTPYRPQIERGLRLGLTVLAPVFLFVLFFNPWVVDPTRIGWLLDADWGQHVLGWQAFRMDDWTPAFYHQDLVGAPTGLSIIYTDSNPLFGMPLKVFRDLLPDRFQYIGPWFLFCVVLHFYFAYKLLKPHSPNPWMTLAGALALSLLPALYYRMRHDTLMAQWLILWGLHLFLNVNDERRKTIGYAALLGVTGMIHPYLLVMVAAIWSGDMIRRVWPQIVPPETKEARLQAIKGLELPARAGRFVQRVDTKALLLSVRDAGLVLLAPIITMGICGTYSAGQSPGAGGFNFYSMGLDALINPVRKDFSLFMRAWPQDGGQAFEGYQYLGFGLIVLIALAGVLYAVTPESKAARPVISRFKPMILPFLGLFLLAISGRVQLYDHDLIHIRFPEALANILAILRASGRFFWPIAYTMVALAVIVLFKSRPRIAVVALPVVLVLQLVDLQGFAAAMRKATRFASEPYTYYVARDEAWKELVGKASGVEFYPVNTHFNDRLFYEVSWRATSERKPVYAMYAARQNVIQMAVEAANERALRNGEIDDDHLYVFLEECTVPASLRPLLREVDGAWVIPPKAARGLGLPEADWEPVTSKVKFGWLDQGACLLDNNWGRPSTAGTWTEAAQASVILPVEHMDLDIERPRDLRLRVQAFSRSRETVAVRLNGVEVGTLTLGLKPETYDLPISSGWLREDDLTVTFDIEPPGALIEVSSGAPPAGRIKDHLQAVAGSSFMLMSLELTDKAPEVES